MDFASYTDPSVTLAVDLVNTRPEGRWPEEIPDLDALAAFLVEHDIPAPPSLRPSDIAAVHALRDRLVEAVEAKEEAAAAETLNGVLADTAARPRITRHDDDGWHLHYTSEGDDLAACIGAVAAMGLAAVLAGSGLQRLGICADSDCDSYFVDSSRNASRRYCCQRCAVRSGVAAHRARARAQRDA